MDNQETQQQSQTGFVTYADIVRRNLNSDKTLKVLPTTEINQV